MIIRKFSEALQNYHHRKLFPELYPDTLEEFSEYVSEEMIRSLLEDWKKQKDWGVAM